MEAKKIAEPRMEEYIAEEAEAAPGPASPVAPLEAEERSTVGHDDVEDETDKENKAPTDDKIVAEWFDAIKNALTACAEGQENKKAWVARRGRKAS